MTRKLSVLSRVSSLAVAAALTAGAAAQSLLGTPEVVFGSVNIIEGTGTTNVSVFTPTAVVDWTPDDNLTGTSPINFQSNGTTATFRGFEGDYTILNRILVADNRRQIFMNGTIESFINSQVGGNVFFYSPSGFLIGSGATINVGSLLLTASPIAVDGNGGFINGGTVVFGQAPNPAAIVGTVAGSQINALNQGSYVALVAPRVVHQGTINVNGAAALVGAEAATITFRPSGLFDIQVDSGTADANGVYIDGNINGPASSGAGDFHRVYAVAVPKNQAMTMVIAGGADLGFDVAGAADVDGNAIVLSAGYNVVNGVANNSNPFVTGNQSTINAANANATSALTAAASNSIFWQSTGNTTLSSDVSFYAPTNINLYSFGANASLTVEGNVLLSGDRTIAAGSAGSSGIIGFYATDGGTTIARRDVTLTANVTGDDSSTAGVAGGFATGGDLRFQAQSGSTLIVDGNVTLTADGYGGNALASGVNAGFGRGGSANVGTFDANSSVTVGGTTVVSASGYGGSASCIDCNGVGGQGRGGTVYVGNGGTSSNASMSLGNSDNGVLIFARGVGGQGAGGTAAGAGLGGTIFVWSQGSGSILDIASNLSANADGEGGYAAGAGVSGGAGTGGQIYVNTNGTNSELTVGGTTDLFAGGYGGDGSGEGCVTCNGSGGSGTGGVVQLYTNANSAGSVLTFNGNVSASANGSGGAGVSNGGAGTGGQASTTYAASTAISYLGDLSLAATGDGGNGDGSGNGGNALGGRAFSGSQAGATLGSLTVAGNALMDASAYGGGANGTGAGGSATGGQSDNGGSAGTIDFQGNVDIQFRAFGGYSELGVGGNATGGQGWLDGFGADIHIGGDYQITGFARGGSGDTGGGNATGGNVFLVATNGASIVTLDGDGYFDSSAQGGNAQNGNSGTAQAGQVNVRGANGGLLDIEGSIFAYARGEGGSTDGEGAIAGDGRGGTITVTSAATGTLDITGSVTANADGIGGYANDPTGFTGDGFGGFVFLRANSGGLTRIGGAAQLVADGYGGNAIECLVCGGDPGNGTGGRVDVLAVGTNSRLILQNNALFQANGWGGLSSLQSGGLGTGGRTSFGADTGGTVTLTGDVDMEANGYGGDDFQFGTAGNGVGGTSQIFTFGAGANSLTVGGSATLEAYGFGGNVFGGPNGEGGDGTGGVAIIAASAGPLSITGPVQASAVGVGGDAAGGAGGNGTGGSARMSATNGSTLRLFSNLLLEGNAIGGSGATGGNAVALVSPPSDETLPTAVGIFVDGNGSIQVDGATTVNASALGGNATNGDGGNASAGEVDVAGFTGNTTLQALVVDASGTGGNGGAGGNGGSGAGGVVEVVMGLSNQSIGGTTTIASALIDANGYGGAGGDGNGGNFGSAGGSGGDGTGGGILYTGSAAGGNLISGAATLSASGYGGDGGWGGDGDSGTGGDGGAGGTGTGGSIHAGTVSFDLSPTTGGSASFTTLAIETVGEGGDGGDGGLAGGGDGLGGQGGVAVGGSAAFLVRGVPVTVDTVNLDASAYGGVGGLGSTDGAGGDATIGTISVESKDRFNHPDQRGTLTANAIIGLAEAVGGTGSNNGISYVRGGSMFRVLNGDATIGTVSITLSGDVNDPIYIPSLVSVRDGTATIGDFSFVTDGQMFLDASNGSMVADTINLAAGSFLVDDVSPPQTAPGSYSADVFNVSTGLDFNTNADLVSGGNFLLDAPGLIAMRNLTSLNGGIDLIAGSSITTGNLASAGDTYLDALGNIQFGTATADIFDFSSSGSVTGGDIIAGTKAVGDAAGAILLGNISVGIQRTGGPTDDGFAAGFESATSISVGNVEADESIGFATFGNLSTGTLDAGVNVMALVGGNMTLGAITTPGSGRTYLADSQMYLDAGGPDDFDPTLVLAATPVRTGGSILIGGPVSTGQFQAAAGTTLTAQAITAPLGIYLDAGGAIVTGALSSNEDIEASSDATIQTGAVTSQFGDVLMSANGSVATGAVAAGGVVQLTSATGSVTTGNVNSPGAVQLGSASGVTTGNIISNTAIQITNGGSITTGNIQSTGGSVGLQSGANIATGTIQTPTDALLSATGSISVAGVNAGGNLFANAGTGLTIGTAVADSIIAAAGGTATINGLWQSPNVSLSSSDIDIAAAGGIDAGANGTIFLQSTNANGALIGDGLTGSGYALSNAEFGRISGGDLIIVAGGAPGADGQMRIGDLSITGPLAGSTIESNGGGVTFATLDEAGEGLDGNIRIVGDVAATGFGEFNYLEFLTQNFELDAATGSIAITSTGSTLSGELYIAADRIHVASGTILDRLAADPNYAGRFNDLNAPATVQRPEGVVRAASIDVYPTEALLVQNTGTAATPAGFLTFADGLLFDEGEVAGDPIELVINGQLITDNGTLTGSAVRDFLVDDSNAALFTPGSTINGCLLTGSCATPLFQNPTFTPVPGIQQEITLVTSDAPEPPVFGNEEVIDDNDESTEDSKTSPIEPPLPLFDTSQLTPAAQAAAEAEAEGGANGVIGTPMRSQPGLRQDGDVDDPVSGSGNPALMDAPPPPAANQEKRP